MTLPEAIREVQASPDLRLIRRVPPVSTWNLQPATGEVVRACIVDTETTGTGSDAEVVELAILPFDYCRETGRVVAVHEGFSALCQPSKPIPAEATAIHGITDEMVAGCSISVSDVAAAVGGAKLLVAFKATFDRGMCAKSWPGLDAIPWGCAYEDVAWKEPGKLGWILYRYGFFHDAHRAMDDCIATLFALTQQVGDNSALFALLQRLREPLYKVTVKGTRFEAKDMLKARRYQWNGADKSWWKTAADVNAEMCWFAESAIDGTLYTEKLAVIERHRVAG
jgi:DNA polymerase-3 subunit epsilon